MVFWCPTCGEINEEDTFILRCDEKFMGRFHQLLGEREYHMVTLSEKGGKEKPLAQMPTPGIDPKERIVG